MKTILTLIIAFFATLFVTTSDSDADVIELSEGIIVDADLPQAPISTHRMNNDYENTLVLEVVNDMTIDVCYINEQPGELIISVSDEVGNMVAGVVITPALLASYLQTITPAQFAA